MYKITCYKCVLTPQQLTELTDDEIKDLCQFDYTVETTREMFYALNNRKLHFITDNVFTKKIIIACYFSKCFEKE